mgnify:CR=1 FL=1
MLPGWHVTSVPLVSVRFGCGACGDVYETQVPLGGQLEMLEGMADVHSCPCGPPDDGGDEEDVPEVPDNVTKINAKGAA